MAELFRIDPVTRHVRGLPGKYWLPREAAVMLGVSRERLIRLSKLMPEQLGPGGVTWLGGLKIYLYTDEDLEQLSDYFTHRHDNVTGGHSIRRGRGRLPLWSVEEGSDRQRRRVNARYHRARAEHFERVLAPRRAAKHWARAHHLTEQLHAEQLQRQAERA